MKKEIIIRMMYEGNDFSSIVHRSGFQDNISSSFEIIGMLSKLLQDEQTKLNEKLKTKINYSIKEPINKDGGENLYN
jgi:hypothetical protein